MTTALAAIAPTLDKLIRRLGSNHDGERLATVAAIERVLKTNGADWHDLAGHLITPITEPRTEAVDDWRTMRRFCANADALLSAREKEFITDLKRWRGELTPKQRDWLTSIFKRLQHEATA
jgi:hypothetical protein